MLPDLLHHPVQPESQKSDWCLFLPSLCLWTSGRMEPAEASKCQSSLLHPLTSLMCVLHMRTHAYSHSKHIQKQSWLKAVPKLNKAWRDSKLYLFIIRFLKIYLHVSWLFGPIQISVWLVLIHRPSLCGPLLAESFVSQNLCIVEMFYDWLLHSFSSSINILLHS